MILLLNLAVEKKKVSSVKKEQHLFFACTGVIKMLTAEQHPCAS